MIEQEILSKLANNEELTQEELTQKELEFMVMVFPEVHSEIIGADRWGTTISSILEVDEDLYYEVTRCVPNNAEDTEYQQPCRVKKTTKTVEVFEPYED